MHQHLYRASHTALILIIQPLLWRLLDENTKMPEEYLIIYDEYMVQTIEVGFLNFHFTPCNQFYQR